MPFLPAGPLTIVFDLDGTLVETAPDLVETLNVILAAEGLPPLPYEKARLMVGGGARHMIEQGLAAEGRVATPQALEAMFNAFIAYYSDHVAVKSYAFPGLVEALDALEADGHRFAVCTNKLEHLSRLLLDALGLSNRFRAICGQDTFGVAKPDPTVLLKTIDAAGGDPRRAIMVGDSATDIHTAQAAGIPVIAVDFGYTDEPVQAFSPDRVISHYDTLLDAVRTLRS